jgi:D-arabinose 1-dehydrogenase-like Zn-dependent alcohol dehydrogenase
MLVLVAGATGNMGGSLIDGLLAQGHRVRALSRNPSKLDASRREKLEDFIQMTSFYDIPALDQACRGVDAVICAYAAVLELQLEGQLLLLRAAERSSSVTKFVAASWNFDWTRMKLGEHVIYDPYISFKRQAELSSSLNVCYIGHLRRGSVLRPGTCGLSTEIQRRVVS